MFALINENERDKFINVCQDDVVGAIMVTRLKAYNVNSKICSFYMNENDVCVSSFDGCLSVVCNGNLSDDENEEIEILASILGCKTILSKEHYPFILKFPPKKYETEFARDLTGENVRFIFPLLFDENENVDFDSWYVDISHKLRHNLIHGKVIFVDGKAVSVSLTSGETKKISVISSVKTDINFRHRGYGTDVVRALVSTIKTDVYIMCDNENTKKWYEEIL